MAGENIYKSKYFTAEEIDQRLLQGYYDDAVEKGYTGTKENFLSDLLSSLSNSNKISGVIHIGEFSNIQEVWDACKQVALNNPEISIIKYSVKPGLTYNSGVVFQSFHYNDHIVTQYYFYGGGQKHECNVRHIVTDGTEDTWQPLHIYTSFSFENGSLYGYRYGKSSSSTNKIKIIEIPNAKINSPGLLSPEDKSKLTYLAKLSDSYDLNTYTDQGVYQIYTGSNEAKNYPIQTPANSVLRLTVLDSYDGNNHVITQVLNINNKAGGEGNIYIRSNQNHEWKPWGKLQTNVEVGQITPDGMSNLTDNGIYSGVCVDGATVETFVLIVINNYLAATQAGFGSYISQLKYAIDLNRGNTVKTRTRDAYGTWNEWSEIGGSTYELPQATVDTLGGVRLGRVGNAEYVPLTTIMGTGVDVGAAGVYIDSAYFKIEGIDRSMLSLRHNSSLEASETGGLSVALGTDNQDFPVIPCCIGTIASLGSSPWYTSPVGIPYNPDQFYLHNNGLNLKEGIGSATKITWDANSDMDDYTTAGVYDIEGTRESLYDSLPIANIGENATIAARLIVTVTPEGATTYRHSIGQTLILSNAEGKETKVYTRNGNRTSTNGGVSYTISWSNWKCLQGMAEYSIVTDEDSWGITDSPTANAPGFGMHGFIENGMYSGIYTDDYTLQSPTFVETFVLVVINDYAVSSQAGTPRRISQLKYATDTLTGQCTVKKRVGTGDDSISWGDWEEIGGGSVTANKSDKLEDYFPDLSNLQDGIYEFYGTLPNDDNEGTVWRYIFDDMGYHGDTCVYCKLVININLPDPESGNMFVFGNGKAASIKFDIFTRKVTTANIL